MLGRASETLMVKHMGLNSSPLRHTFKADNGEEVTHEWPRRLGKIPNGRYMLVDRGFAKHSLFYPNKNWHLFPSFAGKRKQFTKDERTKDKILCRLRWVNEANFSRMLYVRCLKDIVGWSFVKLIPYAVSWGFAISNLQQPFFAGPAPPEGGHEQEGDMSSTDGGHGSQDNIDEDMSVAGDDEQSVREEDTGSHSGEKRQFSPDRLGGRAMATGSPDKQRQRRK